MDNNLTSEEALKYIQDYYSRNPIIKELEISQDFMAKWNDFIAHGDLKRFDDAVDSMTLNDYLSIIYENRNMAHGVVSQAFARVAHNRGIMPFYLYDMIDEYLTFNAIHLREIEKKKVNITEKDYVDCIWEVGYFNDVLFTDREYEVSGIGKIDILGIHPSGRPVVIECKLGKVNPNKQLIAYSSCLSNPILIGITEEPISKKAQLPNINYLTYYEMGIRVKDKEYDESNPPIYGIYAPESGWR